MANYLSRPYSEGPIEVLPGILSDDKRLLACSRDLADQFESNVANTKDGFIESPYILGNLNALRQIAGFPMDPMGSKPPVHSEIPQDKRFFELLALVTKELTRYSTPSGISINKISSIGFPERTNNIVTKLRSLHYFINNFDKIVSLSSDTLDGKITIDDWVKHVDFAPFYLEGRRFQHTDSIRKEKGEFVPRLREVYDWTGKKVSVNREIKGYSDFFRTRARFVYGATGHLNYGAQFFSTALRNAMSERFKFMFYTGPHNFASKVSDFKYALSADVTQFDQNFDHHVVNTIIDNIACYDDKVKTLMRLMAYMPVVQKNDYIGQKGWTVSADTSKSLEMKTGSNPSGWAWVTEFAKICGVTLMCCVYDKYRRVTADNIAALLEGKLDVGFLNTGDDMVFLFKNETTFHAVKQTKEFKFYRFKLDVEQSVNYLGMSLRKSGDSISTLLDIRNIPIKLFVPERRIGTVHKPFFAFGLRQKLDVYSSHPLYEKVFYALNDTLVKHFGEGLLKLVPLDKKPESSRLTNIADAIFFENPDAIYYKIKPSDVNPSLLSSVYAFVGLENFSSLRRLLKEK
jgi:hypothetical protein